jgi:hypothetical protein
VCETCQIKKGFCNYGDEPLDSVQAWNFLIHLKIKILKCSNELDTFSVGYVCIRLLYIGYRVFLRDKEQPGRDAVSSPPSSAVVMRE